MYLPLKMMISIVILVFGAIDYPAQEIRAGQVTNLANPFDGFPQIDKYNNLNT